MNSGLLNIQVVYGLPGETPVLLQLPAGATLGQALDASGLIQRVESADLQGHVGIFGRLCERGHLLQDGDRVEIYRPLPMDPKEARRRRVGKRRR